MHAVVAGDTLWDLARAYLGSGDRWHQIYALNRGRPQPGGGTLTDPARIYPGWDLLIPAARPTPAPPREPARHRPPGPAPPHAGTGRQRVTRPGPQPPPGAQHPGRRAARRPPAPGPARGTAAVRGAARAGNRRRGQRRRRAGPHPAAEPLPARPGAHLQPRTPAPPPPVISALDRAARGPGAGTGPPDGTSPDDTDPDLDLDLYEPDGQPFPDPREAGRAAPPAARLIPRSRPATRAPSRPGPARSPSASAAAARSRADPAALGGLGLTGPGAPAAARAILAGLLARPPRGPGGTPAEIIIPAADAARLLPGPPGPQARPPIRGVWVPPALDAALDEAEAMIVRRARTADHQDRPQAAAVLLAAAPGPADAQRLAGVTGAGRDLGVAVILLGDWPHGTTCHITASGLISGTMPPEADLAGTQAYHLAAGDLAAIIAQLDQARETPGDGPAAPGPPGPGQPQPGAPAAPGPAPADAPPRPAQHPPAGAAGPGAGPGPAGPPVQISVLGPVQVTARGREIGTGLGVSRRSG